MTVRLVLCGLGGVARNLVRLTTERHGITIVGGYSRNASHVGRDIGELADVGPIGVVVTDRAAALATEADVLLVATTSFFAEVVADVLAGLDAGRHVVCTAEEMADPWDVDPALAVEIDRRARAAGVTAVGAGANPGYIYEVVGLALTGGVWRIDEIRTQRVVDLSGFGATVQRRLGIGYSREVFADKVRDRQVFGHIGFPHTIRTFARRFGVTVDRIDETIEPIVEAGKVRATAVPLEAGGSAGLQQRTVGWVDGRPWFSAEFIGHVDPASAGLLPRDSYEILGLPDIRASVSPGFDPQWTTAGALANLLPLVVAAPAGLVSITDLPIPTPWR